MEIIDYRAFKHNGTSYALLIVPDMDSSTDEADCYSATDIEMHDNGYWRFVGLIVKDESGDTDSLWGCQYGTGDGWTQGAEDFISDDYYAPALAREIEEGKS